MKIIVASDQHLGYANADKPAFDRFLDSLASDEALTDLVLLGDVVDMWRRDASGVFLENHDTIKKIIALTDQVQVHYVPGNHDYHALELKGHSYPFSFVDNLQLEDGPYKYRFVHGYEYDEEQTEPMMEALCRLMSDSAGQAETELWSALTLDWSNFRYWISALLLGNKAATGKAARLLETPEKRLPDFPGPVEKSAFEDVKPGEILVFGHTHKPFISQDGNLVNSGSWVSNSTPHNTYVELVDGVARLFVFEGAEITDRIPSEQLSVSSQPSVISAIT